MTVLRWIFAIPIALISGLFSGGFFDNKQLITLADMVGFAATQCLITPLVFLVVFGSIMPSEERLTGIVVTVIVAICVSLCLIPACVVVMLHAGLSANYLNEMGGFYLGGTLGGASLAVLYILTLKRRVERKLKATS